jgi:hypothetical protein
MRRLAALPLPFSLAMHALTAPAGYCLVLALWGAAREHLAFSTPARAYLTEASLPIYVLHQGAIVLLGSFIIQMHAGVAEKLTLLLATSVALTLAVYHFGVRPSRVLSTVLGVGQPPSRASGPRRA